MMNGGTLAPEKRRDRARDSTHALSAVERQVEDVGARQHLRDLEAVHEALAVHPAACEHLLTDARLLTAAERRRRDRGKRQRDAGQ